MEAVKGVSKEVSINGNKRTIKIPAGIYEGATIDFGDFRLSVNIKPHKMFERQDNDIYVNVAIPFSLAVMGGEIKVPTIEDEIKIRIRPGTQSGTMMRLREQGVTHLHGRGKGDEYVRINIVVPEKLSRQQKSLMEEMKEEGL
jgi:DnaJ-class molecular chaperone